MCLTSLVDNSLLQQVETADGDARFMMLETIREYALERLVATGERAPLRQQHAGYYLRLAEQAEPELDRQQQDIWLERLEREHDNLLAALDAAWEQKSAEVALRLCGALAIFWHTHGYLSEGRRWIDAALSIAPADPALTALRAKALSGAGRLALTQGDYAAGSRALRCGAGALPAAGGSARRCDCAEWASWAGGTSGQLCTIAGTFRCGPGALPAAGR